MMLLWTFPINPLCWVAQGVGCYEAEVRQSSQCPADRHQCMASAASIGGKSQPQLQNQAAPTQGSPMGATDSLFVSARTFSLYMDAGPRPQALISNLFSGRWGRRMIFWCSKTIFHIQGKIPYYPKPPVCQHQAAALSSFQIYWLDTRSSKVPFSLFPLSWFCQLWGSHPSQCRHFLLSSSYSSLLSTASGYPRLQMNYY